MIGIMKNGKQMTNRQRRFIREIIKYNYNKDEAYAEIINTKSKYCNYEEYKEIIEDYFKSIKEV